MYSYFNFFNYKSQINTNMSNELLKPFWESNVNGNWMVQIKRTTWLTCYALVVPEEKKNDISERQLMQPLKVFQTNSSIDPP